MKEPDQAGTDVTTEDSLQPILNKKNGKQRTIQSCNFRSAGRLSNENARALTLKCETFARYLTSSVDAYLGTGLEVKMSSLDQAPVKDHVATLPQVCFLIPLSHSTTASSMILECDIHLVFTIIELLLGGTGATPSDPRELSEIEEEIMQDVTALIARQAEQAFSMEAMSLLLNRRIRSSLLSQYCGVNDKVTIAAFEIDIAGIRGSLKLVFPASFLNLLLTLIKLDQPQKKGGLRFFPSLSIRERIVDCDVVVAAGLPQMKVSVRDLIDLQPGSVLKLRAPVRSPGVLTLEGREIFEALPVRNGSQKAAQLGRPSQRINREGD